MEYFKMTKKKTTKRRARTKKGTYKGDDLSTPDVNEAYVKENMFHMSVIESYINTMKRFHGK